MADTTSSDGPAGTPRSEQSRPTALPDDVMQERMNIINQAENRVNTLDQKTATPEATTSTSKTSPPADSDNGGSSPVVPAYPYNTSLAPFLNLSPHHATAVGGTPDDSEVTSNLPSVQVDYLSHDWSEEDVWMSWRATTKHKANIVNGLRLENASWRTWNKQRNNLKTISPETLNWLKDSDVTWLYGPLHQQQVETTPRPKDAGAAARLGLEDQAPRVRAPGGGNAGSAASKSPKGPGGARQGRSVKRPKKPILKYRSLSDILTVPSLNKRGYSYESEESPEGVSSLPPPPSKVVLASLAPNPQKLRKQGYTSTAASTGANTPTGYGSPRPRSPEESPVEEPIEEEPSPAAAALGASAGPNQRRRHIAFANRVEQCIAVDTEEDRAKYGFRSAANASQQRWRGNSASGGRSGSYFQHRSSSEEDDEEAVGDESSSDDDDDDTGILTFRSSRHPQQPAHPPPAPPASSSDNCTIAKLAPTVLKSSDALPVPSPPVVFSPESLASALPDVEGSEDQQSQEHYASEPKMASQPSASAPYVSSPLAAKPRASSEDSQESSGSNTSLVSEWSDKEESDISFEDAQATISQASQGTDLEGSTSPQPPKAAIPSAKATSDPTQMSTSPSTSSATYDKNATPGKSILKKSASTAVPELATGSETEEHTSASDASSTMSSAASTASSMEGTPAIPLSTASASSTQSNLSRSDAAKAEAESRGRSVVRSGSCSSLDGRSASRNPSLGSGGGSVSPVTSEAQPPAQPQSTKDPMARVKEEEGTTETQDSTAASDKATGAAQPSLKDDGEDSQRRSLRLMEGDSSSSSSKGASLSSSAAPGSSRAEQDPFAQKGLPSTSSSSSSSRPFWMNHSSTQHSQPSPALPSDLPVYGETMEDASFVSQAAEAARTGRDAVHAMASVGWSMIWGRKSA